MPYTFGFDSTQEQAEHGYSVGEQQERLLAYCKAKDWAVAEVYIDGGYTGSNLDRPAIQKLKADIKNFDVVLVYKLDRLSRSQFDILDLIEKTFLPNGVDFVSMSEAFDTSTPFGRAMIGILGVFAQLEREQIKERSLMGRKARAKEGKWHGGGLHNPIGYDYVDGRLVIHEHEAEQIRFIFESAAEGKSSREIIRALNAAGLNTRYNTWSMKNRSKIPGVLNNTLYLGIIKFDDVVTENSHEPIVTRELFDKANAVWDERAAKYGKGYHHASTLLSGLVWCSHCGSRFGTRVSRDGKGWQARYYACYGRFSRSSPQAKAKDCMNKAFRTETLDAVIEEELKRLMFDEAFVGKEPKPRSVDINRIKNNAGKKIADIDKRIKNLMTLYSVGDVPLDVLSETIKELNNEKTALQKQLEKPEQLPQSEVSIDEFREILKNMPAFWNIAELEQKRSLLSSLIRKITVDGEKLNIEWTFGTTTDYSHDTPKKKIMPCPKCGNTHTIRQGLNRCGNQKYKCQNKDCGRHFTIKKQVSV